MVLHYLSDMGYDDVARSLGITAAAARRRALRARGDAAAASLLPFLARRCEHASRRVPTEPEKLPGARRGPPRPGGGGEGSRPRGRLPGVSGGLGGLAGG